METDYLRAMGAGAGFDTKKIVAALVTAEKATKQASIDRSTADVDSSISGMAQLKSSMQTMQAAFQAVDDKRDFNFSALGNSDPASVYANFDSSTAVPGTYKVSVSQLAQNDVFQTSSVSETLEVDTYTLGAAVASGGSASFTYGGITYTQAWDTDAATTINGLVAAINAGSAGSTVSAAATNSTVFTITKDDGSDTQMTKGTIGGTTDGSTSLTISTADTTAGVDATAVDQNSSSAATVVIQVGSAASETVTLSAGSTSLTDLVNSINSMSADVTARLVETSNGVYRVVVEGPQGASNNLTITDSVFGLATSSNKLQAAQNSSITVNGLVVARASNEIDDVVPGLKLDLMAVTSKDVVLSVSRDTSVAKSAITGLVTAYNAFEGIIKGLTGGKTETTNSGSLASDFAIKSIRAKVRDYLTVDSSTPGTTKKSFTDIGISMQQNGLFKVDDATLGAALTDYYDDITLMFSANTDDQSSYSADSRGIAGDISNQIETYLGFSGIVKSRDAGYATKKLSLTDAQAVLDKKMVAIETRYTQQFSTMSRIMDEMKSTQDYLESSLDNLPFTSDN